MSLTQGVQDAWGRREPRHRWKHCKGDALWLTPYFSAGVWISISPVLVAQV